MEVCFLVYGFESNSFFLGNIGVVVMLCGELMIVKFCSRSCIFVIVIYVICVVFEEKVGKFIWVSLLKLWLIYNYF